MSHFANCADFALGLREQFGKSSKSGNGKADFKSLVISMCFTAVAAIQKMAAAMAAIMPYDL